MIQPISFLLLLRISSREKPEPAWADAAPGGNAAPNKSGDSSDGLQEHCAYVAEILHGLWAHGMPNFRPVDGRQLNI